MLQLRSVTVKCKEERFSTLSVVTVELATEKFFRVIPGILRAVDTLRLSGNWTGH